MKRQQLFNSFWPSLTSAVLATQPAWADTVQVTTVRLNPTDSGIEVILETPSSASPTVLTSSYGETFVANIINAQLRFPKGNTFRASNPTDGIAGVTVTSLNANSIRVTAKGSAGVPVGQMVRSDRGLVLSLRATSDTSLTQAQSRPPKSDQLKSDSITSRQLSQNVVQPDRESNPASDNGNSQVAPNASPTPTSPVSPEPANSDIRTQETSAPSYLNPSPNPLQFPTQPEEVQIQGTQPITLQQAFDLARRNNRQLQVEELNLARSRAQLRQQQAALYPTLRVGTDITNRGENVFSNNPQVVQGRGANVSPNVGADVGANVNAFNTTGLTPNAGTGAVTTGIGTTAGTAAGTGIGTTAGTAAGTVTGTTVDTAAGTGAGTTAGTAAGTGIGTTVDTAAGTGAGTTAGTTAGTVTGTPGVTGGNTGTGTNASTNVGGNGQTSQSNQQGGGTITTTSPPSVTGLTGTVSLSYDLYTSGARRAGIRAAEEQLRFDQLDVEREIEQLRLDVSNDYYDLQQADESVRINQAAVTNAQASLRDAQALEQAGVGTRFDVLRSQVQLANATQDLTNSLRQQLVERRQLAQRLSLAQSVNVSAADPVEIAGLWNFSLEDSIVLAFQNRAELEQFLAQRNQSEQRRRLALSRLGPQVTLAASYNPQDAFNDDVNFDDNYSLGASVSLLLFDGGEARAAAAAEEANIAIAETNFADTRNQVRFQVEEAFANLQSNLANIQTASVALEQAREALRLARLRFQAGVGTQTDVIAAENDLTENEGRRVTAILDYNRSLATLQRAVSSGQPR